MGTFAGKFRGIGIAVLLSTLLSNALAATNDSPSSGAAPTQENKATEPGGTPTPHTAPPANEQQWQAYVSTQCTRQNENLNSYLKRLNDSLAYPISGEPVGITQVAYSGMLCTSILIRRPYPSPKTK